MISIVLDRRTSVPMVKIVEVLDPTNTGNITTTTIVTATMIEKITVVMTMVDIRTTRVDTRVTIVEMIMGVCLLREISVRLNASSARKLGTMQMNAQKRRLMEPTSQTLFRRVL